MQQQATWYNAERVSQPGSVILNTWRAERMAKKVSNQAILSSDPAVVDIFMGARPASSGYTVNENTAMQVSAVAACIQILGGTIGSLPLPIYERTASGRSKVDSPLWWLLNEQPCPAWTATSMFEWWLRSNALRGDAYARILRNRGGIITGLLPLHPDRVTPYVDPAIGDIRYYYQPRVGNAFGIYADDMLHIPGFGYDGETGRSQSIIQSGGFQSIGIALAADDFSGKFFANGATPKHILKTAGKLSDDQIDQLRKSYAERYTGPDNVGKPMVLTQGLEATMLSMSAVDAELLASRKYQVIDIARAFGVPPHMIGATEVSSSWGTGIEQMTLGFVKFTLKTYLTRIEQEINRKFFRTTKYFVEFNLEGLLSGDSKAEGESLRQARGGSMGPGWMTTNEIRRIKNLPPIAGGDEIYNPVTDSKGTANAQETPPAAA